MHLDANSSIPPKKHHPINGLGVFIRHSFPKPDRKSCPTALCCFIKEGKVENRRPKPEATCLRMFTTRLKLVDHATTPIKADPALGSCPWSKTFLKEWDKQSHGSAVPPQATGNYSSVSSDKALPPALFTYLLSSFKLSSWFVEGRKKSDLPVQNVQKL